MPALDYIAAPDALLGLLQRGRGEGYRRVLNAPVSEAHDLLVQCISRDPRLDSQVESRDEYYASIAVDIELPLEPLAEYLRRNDDPSQGTWATPLTVTTLTELAKRNYRNASEILCDYIKWGQWWNWPLDDLLSLPDDEHAPQIACAIEEHFPSEDALDEAMRTWPTEQFVKLSAHSSRIAASISKVSTKSTEAISPDAVSLPTRELLKLADQKNYRPLGKAMAEVVAPSDVDLLLAHVSLEQPFITFVALAGLAKLAPPFLSKKLSDFWLTIPESSKETLTQNHGFVALRQAVSRAMLALPPSATLPLARVWLNEEHPRKQDLAEKLFRSHATLEDISLLRASLKPMLEDEEAEWGCFMIQSFNHLPGIGPVPELIDIYNHFRFSMGRSYAAEAIQITSPEFFAEKLAFECLWDCEEGTRELGAKFAPLEIGGTQKRISHIANNRFESEKVREAAKERLKHIT